MFGAFHGFYGQLVQGAADVNGNKVCFWPNPDSLRAIGRYVKQPSLGRCYCCCTVCSISCFFLVPEGQNVHSIVSRLMPVERDIARVTEGYDQLT